MAGTIKLRFTTQALDFSPLTRGRVTVKFQTKAGQAVDLFEDLVQGAASAYKFQEVAWIDGSSGEDAQQAINFAQAINRDYKGVGLVQTGFPQLPNISAQAVGNEVTITALEGTFLSGSSYTGNVLVVAIDPPSNTADPTTPVISVVASATGDCNVINYNVTATTGVAPFRLVNNGVDVIPSWNGSTTSLALARGSVNKIFVEDLDGEFSVPITVNVPRKLDGANFEVALTPGVGNSDVTVNWPEPVAGVTPLEYALTAADAVAATGYQSSNVFPAVLEGAYKLWVRDKFGCEVTKLVTVAGYADPVAGSTPKYSRISDFNTLSFSRRSPGRKNYDTALSFEEVVGVPKQALFEFTAEDQIQTQFRSSFPFHQITLHKCDGSKEDLPFLLIQQNIGVAEKVDCKVFPVEAALAGVYFVGGNSYEPGTLTVTGSSPYSSGLPTWAETGRFVSVGSMGTKEIKGVGYDSDLGVMYFTVEASIAAQADDTVQATYNRHDYNLYRCDFPMSKVSDRAYVTIEMGYSSTEIEVAYQSEAIRRITDTSKHLKIEWSGFKNLGDMVFVDGYKGVMWIKGRIRPVPIGTAKNYEGSEEVYPLSHTQRIGQRVSIPVMTPKQWAKFGLVSAIAEGGTLLIEDMELVREGAIEAEEQGSTNFSNVECEFAYTGDGLGEVTEEVVLNPSTGVEGGGGTGKEGVTGWEGFTRIAMADGKYLRLSAGAFISFG